MRYVVPAFQLRFTFRVWNRADSLKNSLLGGIIIGIWPMKEFDIWEIFFIYLQKYVFYEDFLDDLFLLLF